MAKSHDFLLSLHYCPSTQGKGDGDVIQTDGRANGQTTEHTRRQAFPSFPFVMSCKMKWGCTSLRTATATKYLHTYVHCNVAEQPTMQQAPMPLVQQLSQNKSCKNLRGNQMLSWWVPTCKYNVTTISRCSRIEQQNQNKIVHELNSLTISCDNKEGKCVYM